jgi:hypothetical protein
MNMPITQLWDSRLVYMYALYSGLINYNEEEVTDLINKFINLEGNLQYCVSIFRKLEDDARINPEGTHTEEKDFVPDAKGGGSYKKMLIKMSSVDSQWFRNMLAAYLEVFKSNLIFVPYAGEEWVLSQQQTSSIIAQLGSSSYARELHGEQIGISDRFLESVLSLAIDGIVKIDELQFFSIDEKGDGTYRAQLTLLQKDTAEIKPYSDISRDLVQAEVKTDGTQIYVGIQGEELLPLWRLRVDSGLYNFMHYMQAHTNMNIGIGDIQLLDGCKSYQDMTEVVRNCRFNKLLKKLFFDGTSKKSVRFTPVKKLTTEQYESFINLLESLRQ